LKYVFGSLLVVFFTRILIISHKKPVQTLIIMRLIWQFLLASSRDRAVWIIASMAACGPRVFLI